MEGVGRPVRTDLASGWVVVNEFVKRRGNRGTMRDRAITVHTYRWTVAAEGDHRAPSRAADEGLETI